METTAIPVFRTQLVDRRQKLEAVRGAGIAGRDVERLLAEVDAALTRLDKGTFGLCETCHDPIETDRLLADPLTQFCIDHLTPVEQRALEHDLELAARVQRELLPRRDVRFDGWELAFHYQPAGAVSGDYCDVLPGPSGDVYFLVGDVAGKGIGAAMLMSHLSAMVRTLISMELPLSQLMERASRVFCESTLPTLYATLVCGRASASGDVEICNAGHPPAIVVRQGSIEKLDANGLPVGMFCSQSFSSHTVSLARGDMLLLYTDGLIEAQNGRGEDYGMERLAALTAGGAPTPTALLGACLDDARRFRGSAAFADDLTMLAIGRA